MTQRDPDVVNNAGMQIRPASVNLWPQIVELLGSTSDSKWCWCQYWRKPGSNWSNADVAGNRADLRTLAEDGDRDGAAPGLVALGGDAKAVGWLGLGPRDDFPRLARSRTIPQLPGNDVWSINCFVVARDARRRGVASALLEAAVAYAGAHGAALVEGYPVETSGARIPSSSVYTGTAAMFRRAGFETAAATTSKAASGTPRVVMRRSP